jgi:hypothetical protein
MRNYSAILISCGICENVFPFYLPLYWGVLTVFLAFSPFFCLLFLLPFILPLLYHPCFVSVVLAHVDFISGLPQLAWG